MSDQPVTTETSNAGSADPTGSAQAPTNGETATLKPRDELTQAQRQRDDYFDQLQRSRAEFANFQKRVKSQADTDRIYAVGNLAKDLLDGLDNLERAIEALRGLGGRGDRRRPGDGPQATAGHPRQVRRRADRGAGQAVDPNQHEALMRQPAADKPEMTVVAELSKGYKIHDRVLRPSQVAVSVKPAESD